MALRRAAIFHHNIVSLNPGIVRMSCDQWFALNAPNIFQYQQAVRYSVQLIVSGFVRGASR